MRLGGSWRLAPETIVVLWGDDRGIPNLMPLGRRCRPRRDMGDQGLAAEWGVIFIRTWRDIRVSTLFDV